MTDPTGTHTRLQTRRLISYGSECGKGRLSSLDNKLWTKALLTLNRTQKRRMLTKALPCRLAPPPGRTLHKQGRMHLQFNGNWRTFSIVFRAWSFSPFTVQRRCQAVKENKVVYRTQNITFTQAKTWARIRVYNIWDVLGRILHSGPTHELVDMN